MKKSNLFYITLLILCACGNQNEGTSSESTINNEQFENAQEIVNTAQEKVDYYRDELWPKNKESLESAISNLKKAISTKTNQNLDSLIELVQQALNNSSENMSYADIKKEIRKEFDNGDPVPLLKTYIKEKKSDLRKILLWFQVLFNYPIEGNEDKLEQIRRGVYQVFYKQHLDIKEGDDKILNYKKEIPVSNVQYTGDQTNIEVTKVTMTIEKSTFDLFGLKLNLKPLSQELAKNNSGVPDRTYYGPIIKMDVEFKVKSNHYYDEKENDVYVDFVFADTDSDKRFEDIVVSPTLQGSNINREFRRGTSSKTRSVDLDLPIWTYEQWNNRENRWMDDLFILTELVMSLSESELKEVRLQPTYNPNFDTNGNRIR